MIPKFFYIPIRITNIWPKVQNISSSKNAYNPIWLQDNLKLGLFYQKITSHESDKKLTHVIKWNTDTYS